MLTGPLKTDLKKDKKIQDFKHNLYYVCLKIAKRRRQSTPTFGEQQSRVLQGRLHAQAHTHLWPLSSGRDLLIFSY